MKKITYIADHQLHIPLYDILTGHEVRPLADDDLDSTLLQELMHHNIRKVYTYCGSIRYQTLEMGSSTYKLVNRSITYPQGHLGTVQIPEEHYLYTNSPLHLAAMLAISVSGSFNADTSVYTIFSTNARWHVSTDSQQSHCSITLSYRGNVFGTYYLRRLWPDQ